MGVLAEDASADDAAPDARAANADFRDKAPLSAAEAATIILDGVRSGAWRILVGEDAKMLDERCARSPRPPTTTPSCSARWPTAGPEHP